MSMRIHLRHLFLIAVAVLVASAVGCVSVLLPSLVEAERIRREGRDAQAVIDRMTQTGWFLNENPEVKFELTVQEGNGSTYHAVTREYIQLIQLGELRRGATISVKVDPADRSKVAIAHEE